MKRLVKYTDSHFDVLPYVVDDLAGEQEMRALAKQLGYKLKRVTKYAWDQDTTHTSHIISGDGAYLAFVKIPKSRLKTIVECNETIDKPEVDDKTLKLLGYLPKVIC